MHIDYEKDSELFIEVNKHLAEYTESMDKVKMRQALLQVLAVSRQGNLYMQVNEPWKLIKSPNEEDK
jgi:methionyl-tRNA synthetase